MPYYPGQRVPARQPVDHRGRMRRDRRLRRRGPLPSRPGTRGHHRPRRPRPGGASQPAQAKLLPRRRGEVQEPGAGRQAGAGLPASRGLLGLPLQGVRRPAPRARLSRPARLRRQPHHRLRRQRRRAQGDGGVPAGTPGPLAHRRGQRHRLGTGPGRKRLRAGDPGGVSRLPGRPATWRPRPRSSAPTC